MINEITAAIQAIHSLEYRDVIFAIGGAVFGVLFGRANRRIAEAVYRAANWVKGKLS